MLRTMNVSISQILIGLFQRPGSFSEVLLRWAVGLVLGGALGIAFRIPMRADRPRRLVALPGSILPLLRVLIIFGAQGYLRFRRQRRLLFRLVDSFHDELCEGAASRPWRAAPRGSRSRLIRYKFELLRSSGHAKRKYKIIDHSVNTVAMAVSTIPSL